MYFRPMEMPLCKPRDYVCPRVCSMTCTGAFRRAPRNGSFVRYEATRTAIGSLTWNPAKRVDHRWVPGRDFPHKESGATWQTDYEVATETSLGWPRLIGTENLQRMKRSLRPRSALHYLSEPFFSGIGCIKNARPNCCCTKHVLSPPKKSQGTI